MAAPLRNGWQVYAGISGRLRPDCALLHNTDLNYEDIIGRIEVEIQRNRSKELHQEWHSILLRYLEAVYFLLFERHHKNKTFINDRLELLRPISKYYNNGPLWIFSLNHDLITEIACNYLNIPIKYGFNEKIMICDLTFEQLTRDDMNKSHFSFFTNENAINLIKLHGSLDVFVQGDDTNYLKLINDNNFSIIDDIAKLIENDVATKQGLRCTNEFTYYDSDNILQFLRISIISGKHKYSTKISHNMDDWFFKIFKGHINYIGNLYCIGYSFQDLHVNSVLYDWLSFLSNRKLIIVNPCIDKIPSGFTHLNEQISLIKLGFLNFLNRDASEETVKIINNNLIFRELSRKKLLNV